MTTKATTVAPESAAPSTTAAKLAALAGRRQQLGEQAEAAASRQHGRHKLTARERIDMLVDPGSFRELDAMARHRAIDRGTATGPTETAWSPGWPK